MSSNPPSKPVGQPMASASQYAYDPTQAVRRLQNNTQFASPPNGNQGVAAADPLSKLCGFKLGFQDTGRVCLGKIVDGTAIANCYKVFVEKGRAPVIAQATTHTSNNCLGATSINTYTPGTSVIIMLHDKIGQAFILGAYPSVLGTGRGAYHDYIAQASRKRVDDCHKKYIKERLNGQMVDWSNWRPFDATLAGEWGAISTTGIRLSIDDFMLQLAVNEFCGIYGFYHDQLLRVAGYNLQVWTAGSERDAYMDQAECNDTNGYSPYPWEAVGMLKPGDGIEVYMPDDYHNTLGRPHYSHWENKNEFQQPYHRTQKFFGYLGQGGRTVVHAPPQGLDFWTYKPDTAGTPPQPYDSKVTSTGGFAPDAPGNGKDKSRTHEEKPAYGLAEDNTGQDGRRFIASAKGIVISKRMLLPMPQRLKRPESGKGDDTEQAYKAASKYGNGPEHKITGDIQTTDSAHPNLQRAAAVLDLHGYLFNYSGLHPFYWHTKDYKTWEQSELEYATCNQRLPDFSSLKGSMYLKEPQPVSLNIDHRYGKQNFYETESFVSLLEDGSVVIGDGYGAEIRMSAGCLVLSAPGDVWIKSGRDAQMWAGGNCVLRANEGVDVSTTKQSVRIKSEKHVMVMAGNGNNDGGVLIESRSAKKTYDFEKCGDDVQFGGVVLRAPNSNIVALGNQMYLRTVDGENSGAGNIMLDAGKGTADIVTKSQAMYNYVSEDGEILHFFKPTEEGPVTKSNMFRGGFTLLNGPLGIDKDIILNGNVLCNGSIGFLASKGHIITKAAAKGAQFVAPCDDKCQTQVNEGIDKVRDYIDKTLPELGTNVDETYLGQLWYDDKQPGNDRVVDIMEFSFRTDEQYAIPDFLLYEDRWQQMARIGNASLDKWTEKPVKSKICDETWPFPGKKWLADNDAYIEQDMGIVENNGGALRDKDRGAVDNLNDAYKAPSFKSNASQKKKINGNYPIIGR